MNHWYESGIKVPYYYCSLSVSPCRSVNISLICIFIYWCSSEFNVLPIFCAFCKIRHTIFIPLYWACLTYIFWESPICKRKNGLYFLLLQEWILENLLFVSTKEKILNIGKSTGLRSEVLGSISVCGTYCVGCGDLINFLKNISWAVTTF